MEAGFVYLNGYQAALPDEARKFIAAYDEHGLSDAAPFNFKLDVPVELMMSRQQALPLEEAA